MSASECLKAAVSRVREEHGDAWDRENHHRFWGQDPLALATTATVEGFSVGTGEELFRDSLLDGLENAHDEVILVTCFWARSPTLDRLCESLRRLSDKALRRDDGKRIRLFIGFSSRSPWQKLFHTSNPGGHDYPPSTWVSKLGLPPSEELKGLEITIKRRFFRPFSVMHSKFLLVDRRTVWMPSCNVSWESWFEGCAVLSGAVTQHFTDFYYEFWGFAVSDIESNDRKAPAKEILDPFSDAQASSAQERFSNRTPVIFLPSPHHSSLLMSFPSWLGGERLHPLTPLNVVLMHLIATARSSIEFYTPNLTCAPDIDAILAALERGVDVTITTSRRMMVAEQLVKAHTTTELCVRRLISRYKKLSSRDDQPRIPASLHADARRVEEGRVPAAAGELRIHYFHARDEGGMPPGRARSVKCHIKCTIFDDAVAVCGSGNMDRASFYSSQELGMAIWDAEASKQVRDIVREGLHGQTRRMFPPTTD